MDVRAARGLSHSTWLKRLARAVACSASAAHLESADSFPRKDFQMAKVNGVVRVGLIGSGGISAAHGKGFLKYHEKIKCIALCDVSQDNLKKRSEQLAPVSGANPPRQF